MRISSLLAFAAMLVTYSCSPSATLDDPDPMPNPCPEPCQNPPDVGHPPPVDDSPETEGFERNVLAVITSWLVMFQDRQSHCIAEKMRYCDEVTLGGRIAPLPKPYKTQYQVHETGKNYLVIVRHPPTTRRCYLQDGEWAAGEPVGNAGRIVCGRY